MQYKNISKDLELKINKQNKEIRDIRNNIDENNNFLKYKFETLGKYTFDYFCTPDNPDNFDTGSHIKGIIATTEEINSCYTRIQKIEDSLIEDLISCEAIKYQNGFENAKLILQEEFCYGEIGELDFTYKLFFSKKFFDKYDQIRALRIQRRENKISWAEMEQNINELLEINI